MIKTVRTQHSSCLHVVLTQVAFVQTFLFIHQPFTLFQAPQSRSRGGLSSRKGLLAGAAGGAVAGGLLGFGMGHAVGSFGDSFDGDCCDFDCD